MVELMMEMLLYLAVAALVGLLLGYLFWGWGTAARISEARADGAAAARTSVDGSAGLREQLQEAERENVRQAEEIERLMDTLARSNPQSEPATEAYAAADDLPSEPNPADAPQTDATSSETMDKFRTSMFRRRTRENVRDELDVPEDVETAPADEIALDAPQTDEVQEAVPAGTTAASGADEESIDVVPSETSSDPATPKGLLSTRPDAVDDLKRIKGVGKVMERVLNDKGIYLFRQLAALDEREAEWVNDAIEAFPGRIHRDKWVRQAQDLHQKKYGQPFDHDA